MKPSPQVLEHDDHSPHSPTSGQAFSPQACSSQPEDCPKRFCVPPPPHRTEHSDQLLTSAINNINEICTDKK